MTDYQKVAQMLEANAIHDYVDAYNKGRADVIEECIEILKDTSRRNCSYLLDEIVYRAVEQMENLKEKKNDD